MGLYDITESEIPKAKQYNVVLYGIGKTCEKSLGYIEERFNIKGCSDSNNNLSECEIAKRYKFYCPDELKCLPYDYILVTSIYDGEICKKLMDEIGIERSKILLRTEWTHIPFEKKFGEENFEKKFYILRKEISSKIGLYGIVFAFLEQMAIIENNGYIPVVDMCNYRNQYLDDEKIGTENAWEYFFEKWSGHTLPEVYSSKNVILGYDAPLYKTNIKSKYNINEFKRLYKKYFRLKAEVLSEVEKEYNRIIGDKKNILGVLYRGSDMTALKLPNHPIQLTIDEMSDLIHLYIKKYNVKTIFVCTEDAMALDEFRKRFSDYIVVYTNQKRFANTGKKWIADITFDRENDKYLRGLEYITAIEILSRCDYLLAGSNTGSICAEIINGDKYADCQIIDKGAY